MDRRSRGVFHVTRTVIFQNSLEIESIHVIKNNRGICRVYLYFCYGHYSATPDSRRTDPPRPSPCSPIHARANGDQWREGLVYALSCVSFTHGLLSIFTCILDRSLTTASFPFSSSDPPPTVDLDVTLRLTLHSSALYVFRFSCYV